MIKTSIPGEVFSRQRVAERELTAAIRNFFLDEDLVAAHLLGWAALDIISDMGKSSRKETLRSKMTLLVPVQTRNAWRKAERDYYNFMKHADRDPGRSIRLVPDMTCFTIYLGCRDYLNVFGTHTAIMAIFTGWYVSQNLSFAAAFPKDYRSEVEDTFGHSERSAWNAARRMARIALSTPDL